MLFPFSISRDANMALNKKQKKQLDVGKKKIEKLRQLLAAAKQQPDDPGDVSRLETEIADLDAELKTIRNG
jgi:hypothetical protein